MFLQGKKKTHKHKQICGIVPGLGGCQNFVYVFFSGHSLWGRKKHINKIPTKSRDNPVKILFTCFFFMCFFRSLFLSSNPDGLQLSECAKRAEKGVILETVVQKGILGESVFLCAQFRIALRTSGIFRIDRENLAVHFRVLDDHFCAQRLLPHLSGTS